MKDEIKEILDRLKDSATNQIIDVPVIGGVSEPIDNSQCLEPNECKILLDYITNLQEENERIKTIWKDTNVVIRNDKKIVLNQNGFDYLINIEQENENKDNKILELQQELLNKKLNVKDIEYKEKMIYKSRNEKAIEYVEKSKLNQLETHCKYLCINFDVGEIEHLDDLLNILQGEDDKCNIEH